MPSLAGAGRGGRGLHHTFLWLYVVVLGFTGGALTAVLDEAPNAVARPAAQESSAPSASADQTAEIPVLQSGERYLGTIMLRTGKGFGVALGLLGAMAWFKLALGLNITMP